MADERTLARRYARGLLAVAQEQGLIDRVEADLHGIAEMWRTSADLRTLVAHPSVARAEKARACRALLAGRVEEVTVRFVELLLEKRRFPLIEDISAEYVHVADEAQGVAKASVTSFLALSEGQRTRLLEKLRRFTDRPNVELEESVDAALLGGIVVRIGDEVLDGSVAGRLRRLRERLLMREEERAQMAAAMAAEALRG